MVLKKNNTLLKNTCNELVERNEKLSEQNEKLEKRCDDDLRVLERLRSAAERDAQTIAEQEKAIHILGKDLKEQKDFVVEAEHALKAKFTDIYEGYKAALTRFGTEPLPFPGDEKVTKIFDWMKVEFEGLPEVIIGISDFAASFCLDSTPAP